MAIKRKNQIEALRILQKLCKLSIDTRSSNSYDASLGDAGEGPLNLLIQQLKANIFEVNLLNAIEGHTQFGIDIKNLLAELNKQRVPYSMVQFLFEFEAYFDQVCRDINLKNTYNNRLQQTREAIVMAWDLSVTSKKEVDRLENQLQEYLDKKASLNE